MPRFTRRTLLAVAFASLPMLAAGCWSRPSSTGGSGGSGADGGVGEKVLYLPMRTDGPKSLDPVRGSSVYDNTAACQVYETLLQYKYLVRPVELEPLLLENMPELAEDGLTYRFTLKKNVRFHDDPCFPEGKGREVKSSDVFYSWKRMADDDTQSKSWWLLENTIVGFDEYRKQQNDASTFDYDAPVEGLKIIDDYRFEVKLVEPVQRFMSVLAMFQTSVVPREAVEKYGDRFGRHPVGTGPFTMKEGDWQTGQRIVFHKNPNYHECYYPEEHMPEDEDAGLHVPAGTRLPIVDRVEIPIFTQDQPMWLQFRSGNLDYTQVPAEYFEEAFIKRNKTLKSDYRDNGYTAQIVPLLDFIFRGFNMEDPLLGGYSEKQKALRQALSLAMDLNEFNDAFYNGLNIVYDGHIPPGLDGYPEGGKAPVSYRGPDIPRAKELLAKAGYPDGKGLPPLEYYTAIASNNQEQTEMMARQLSRINVKLSPRMVEFSTLIQSVDNKKAQFFSFAWGSDYPDAENNLALFYGPNESPGANHFNYKNTEYDKLYEQIRTMPPSPERTEIYERMRDMVIEDAPFIGSMARERYYLVSPRLKNFKASEDFYNWPKYLDVDETVRR